MAKQRRTAAVAPVDPTRSLPPLAKDLGPTLRLEDDGTLRIAFGTRQANWPIGREANEAASLVTYRTTIPEGAAHGYSNLSKEGLPLVGWLLMDGEGQVLGRLANDDELVYDRAAVDAFAATAGLSVEDWGDVDHERIETLMNTPKAPPKGEKRTFGVSGREWLMAVAMLGGMMVAWPVMSQIVFSSERGKNAVLLLTGVSGFLVGAFGLWVGSAAKRLSNTVTMIVSFLLAAGFAVAGFWAASQRLTVWRLDVGQLPTMLFGAALIFLVVPFWARAQRRATTR